MNTIYTASYSKITPDQLLAAAQRLNAKIIDVRYKPFSRKPTWNKKKLQQLMGDTYKHIVAYGNVNYKSGPIQLLDPTNASIQLIPILKQQPIILLCVCASPKSCHRSTAADHLSNLTNAPIHHLTKQEITTTQLPLL